MRSGEAPLEREPGAGVARPDLADAGSGRAGPLEQCGWLTPDVVPRDHQLTVTLV